MLSWFRNVTCAVLDGVSPGRVEFFIYGVQNHKAMPLVLPNVYIEAAVLIIKTGRVTVLRLGRTIGEIPDVLKAESNRRYLRIIFIILQDRDYPSICSTRTP